MQTTATVGLTHCPNCEATLEGPFCARCGQRAAPLNPSLGEFVHDLFHEVAHFDGKIVQSVALLLGKPGFLTREQFEGRRARYVPPIRLYLIFSLVYFAVASFAPTQMVRVTPNAGEQPQEAEARRQELEHVANEALTHWGPRAMFLLVPAFAGLVALTVRRSRRNYPQHLYFALHVHAVWFFVGAVSAAARIANLPLLTAIVPTLVVVYATAYIVLAFRRAYDLSIAGAIGRAAAVSAAYLIVVLAVLAAIVLPAVIRR
jgi:hypothetical protein